MRVKIINYKIERNAWYDQHCFLGKEYEVISDRLNNELEVYSLTEDINQVEQRFIYLEDAEIVGVCNPIKPSHYKAGEFDVIEFCNYHEVSFGAGNIIKYLVRAGKKENNSRLQDLEKAQEYLRRLIEYERTNENISREN